MSAVRLLAVAASLLCAAVIAAPPAADAPGSPRPTAADIAEAVRQLGATRFPVREKAQQTLWRAGTAAEPALRKALEDADPEVVRRAKAVLDKFDWGIYPDTPPAVLTQIERFRGGDEDAKRQAAAELIRLGPPGIAAVAKLVARTDLPDGLVDGGENAIPNYVALALFSGSLPEVIARWEAAAKAGKAERGDDVLAALYRAKGDFAAARKHAAESPTLLADLVWEQGDWKALAGLPAGPKDGAAAIAVRAAYFRLAGDAKAADAELAALGKIDDADDNWSVAKGLLMNGHPGEVIDRLRKLDWGRAAAFDLLVGRMQFKEALALAEGKDDLGEHQSIRVARALYQLGDKDAAGQLFAKAAGTMTGPDDADAMATLVRAEMRLALKAAAREHAAAYLGGLTRVNANGLRRDPLRTVLDAAFPKLGPEAVVWWAFFRQKSPKEDPAATMKRVVTLLDPPAGAAGPGAFADELLATQEDTTKDSARAALATAYESAGQFDAARDQLAKAADADATGSAGIKLGDFLMTRKQYTAAAAAYAEAWKRNPVHPLALALQGWALTKAGRGDEGKALLDQAHVLPLGDVFLRSKVASELATREAVEPARREWAVIRKLGLAGPPRWGEAPYVINVLFAAGRDAAARKDYAAAADAFERSAAGILVADLVFGDDWSSYLALPAIARTYRARATLDAGDVVAALARARDCLDLSPGHMDVALLLVPELDKRGRTADADALYARAAEPYAALAKSYPRSGHAHNALAWLAACCHRDLDGGLTHARTAVELEPKQAGYRDTLAEVHFQRGETVTAVQLMRECIAADPRKGYFAKQLARFEAGDRTVPPPDEDED